MINHDHKQFVDTETDYFLQKRMNLEILRLQDIGGFYPTESGRSLRPVKTGKEKSAGAFLINTLLVSLLTGSRFVF